MTRTTPSPARCSGREPAWDRGLLPVVPALIAGLLLWRRLGGASPAWSPPVLALLTLFALVLCFAVLRTRGSASRADGLVVCARRAAGGDLVRAALAPARGRGNPDRLGGGVHLFGLGMVARRYGATQRRRAAREASAGCSTTDRSPYPTGGGARPPSRWYREDWTQREYYLLLLAAAPARGGLRVLLGPGHLECARSSISSGPISRIASINRARLPRSTSICARSRLHAGYLVSDHGDF